MSDIVHDEWLRLHAANDGNRDDMLDQSIRENLALVGEAADLREALRETTQLAAASFEGDPFFAQELELDGEAIIARALDLLRVSPVEDES